ncbi:ABC transporter permease [Streptomyces physcomitrii]|uniref:ABC transporter permease n=1 Tax=Streptomyces physcomitrii TaxID=2724184 RepID=A0ABX1HBA5_9ACTN|nr:ABC transporter permease [Streptomyces physcomitrii]NKI44605.1 ABC transporter permease [Streptomyces physcomitrii]
MSKQNCLVANDWICGEYLRSRSQDLTDATVQHIGITAASVAIGVLVAFPLALLARRKAFAGPVLGLTTVLYTVPSLAMFSLLLPLFGLSASLVVTGLVMYSLTILVRNILAGLQAVPEEAKEAARGLGYGPARLLWEVELPLALPALLAGVRIATVSTVALTTVGAIVDYGGLGSLILDGLDTTFKAQVLTASVLCVLLALAADLLLLGVQWLLTPWTRATRATRASSGPRIRRRPGAGGGGPLAKAEDTAAASAGGASVAKAADPV